jgi:NADH:ubiquinone oxidoreductase subunit H
VILVETEVVKVLFYLKYLSFKLMNWSYEILVYFRLFVSVKRKILISLFLGSFIFSIIFLISVAYVTLLERHLLGLSQERLGPTKNFFIGILQPFLDAFKLFQKLVVVPQYRNYFLYWLTPIFFFLVFFLQFVLYQGYYIVWKFDTVLIYLICIIGLSVFSHFFIGFFSVSKYRGVGSLRSIVQNLSFEVVFFFILFIFIGFYNSYSVFVVGGFYFFIFVYIFIILVLSEVGRAPFDFTEGESELVRGYNLEYSSLMFIFLFLSEYGTLLLFRVLFSSFILGWDLYYFCWPILFTFFFLLFRSAYPRYRYDLLMSFFWFLILPFIIQIVFFFFSFCGNFFFFFFGYYPLFIYQHKL